MPNTTFDHLSLRNPVKYFFYPHLTHEGIVAERLSNSVNVTQSLNFSKLESSGAGIQIQAVCWPSPQFELESYFCQEKETDSRFPGLPTIYHAYIQSLTLWTWGSVQRHFRIFVSLAPKWQRRPWWKFTNKMIPKWSIVFLGLSVSYSHLKTQYKDGFSLHEKNERFLTPILSKGAPDINCRSWTTTCSPGQITPCLGVFWSST